MPLQLTCKSIFFILNLMAIGRALVSSAPIILADEPTGNLDETTAADIIDILRRAAHENDKCVIVVTQQ